MASVHPIVGSWRVAVSIPAAGYAGVNLASFGGDGVATVAFPSPTPAPPGAGHRLEFFTTALGSWEASGAHGAAMTFVSLGADETGAPVGTHTVTATVQVAADGASWSGPFRIAIAGPDGAETGRADGTVTAKRIGTGQESEVRSQE